MLPVKASRKSRRVAAVGAMHLPGKKACCTTTSPWTCHMHDGTVSLARGPRESRPETAVSLLPALAPSHTQERLMESGHETNRTAGSTTRFCRNPLPAKEETTNPCPGCTYPCDQARRATTATNAD